MWYHTEPKLYVLILRHNPASGIFQIWICKIYQIYDKQIWNTDIVLYNQREEPSGTIGWVSFPVLCIFHPPRPLATKKAAYAAVRGIKGSDVVPMQPLQLVSLAVRHQSSVSHEMSDLSGGQEQIITRSLSQCYIFSARTIPRGSSCDRENPLRCSSVRELNWL